MLTGGEGGLSASILSAAGVGASQMISVASSNLLRNSSGVCSCDGNVGQDSILVLSVVNGKLGPVANSFNAHIIAWVNDWSPAEWVVCVSPHAAKYW